MTANNSLSLLECLSSPEGDESAIWIVPLIFVPETRGGVCVRTSPIRAPDVEGGVGASALGKRATIELYHVTTAASAASIHSGGVKLQVKPTIGDDFNPKGKGGFYINAHDVTTNCADLITFKFDESALTSLKVHKFGPATLSDATVGTWVETPDFAQWNEFTSFCTHGGKGDDQVKLDADLENGGNGLDLIIGPMVGAETVRQYAFRTTKALGHLTVESVTKTGLQ
ncbi:hypothetical protein C8R41DRAFT_925970 [Lentinula lateritia]|uniref:Uncharacterized protein n=1 Tax=Lentinula lateritia TaxID=40482 RepID=A0ABQ8UZN1_9AGAR|nr:hypothetical protein C8R41DRAFT_925970 [Lentinula lateritia]